MIECARERRKTVGRNSLSPDTDLFPYFVPGTAGVLPVMPAL